MSKPVLIEFTRDGPTWPKGTTLAVSTAAKAEKLYPEAKITGYEDGSDWIPPIVVEADDKPAAAKAKASGGES